MSDVPKDQKQNNYLSIFESEVGKEFDEAKENYKAAKSNCKTMAEKKMLMKVFADDLVDIAIEARINGEFELNSEINTYIQALNRRTFSGRRNW